MSDLPRKPNWKVKPTLRSHARSLRRDSTDAERLIWSAIRGHRLNGMSFRRQTPVGPYIVDFVSHAARLVIEIDGGQHFQQGHIEKDTRRDAFLASRGFRILRFNNHEVMTNRQGVLETIAAAISHSPSLPLPRKRGREQAACDGKDVPQFTATNPGS